MEMQIQLLRRAQSQRRLFRLMRRRCGRLCGHSSSSSSWSARRPPACRPPPPDWSSGGVTTEQLAALAGEWPLGRPGQPAELAPRYVDLVDPQSTFVSGSIYTASSGVMGP